MKLQYIALFLLLGPIGALSAQSFEWTAKSTQSREVQPNADYTQAYNQRQTGQAGVYSANAQGSRTVSGEAYVNSQLTASHPLLPVGTILRVQNLDNGRSVSVRINDQGRECPDCLLLLSQAAATELGINYRGRVVVERTGFSNWNPTPPNRQATVNGTAPTRNAPAPVTQPVTVNRDYASRGGVPTPTAYGPRQTSRTPTTYSRVQGRGYTPVGGNEFARLGTASQPSVMAREVEPAPVNRQPTSYGRTPTAYQPTPSYQQPTDYYQRTVPVQQPNVRQAAPPPSTVARIQQQRTVPAPINYQTPAAQPNAYGSSPTLVARGAATVTSTAPAVPANGYAVQLGAYSNEVYAKNRVVELSNLGLENPFYKSFVKADGQVINRVYVGTFPTIAAAQSAAKNIQAGYQIAGIVTRL